MRALSDTIYNALDDNEPWEEQRIPLGETGLTGTSTSDGIDLIRRGDKVVAVLQNGMLHESIVLFETGLEPLLALAGLQVESYELDPIEQFGHEGDAKMPPAAAIWLKRMPGAFFTESALILVPEQVHPRAADDYDYSSIRGDEFAHVLYQVEMAARREQERTWRAPEWSFDA